jgi:DnaJ-class molecular chaperone
MSQPAKSYAPGKCAWCSGTGKSNVAPGMPVSCVVCGGKGHTSIAQPAAQCRECEGSGRRINKRACFTCAGTGWEHISAAAVK